MHKVSIIIPCFNNEENIPVTTKALFETEQMYQSTAQFEYILIDDGSTDGTWKAICAAKKSEPDKVFGVRLSNNNGSYNAINAGLKRSTGDCVVVMAADLQDLPDHIFKMYQSWLSGNKLVLANRVGQPDNGRSRIAAKIYLTTIRLLALPNLPLGGFDFCLFDKTVKEKMLDAWISNTNSLFILLILNVDYVLAPYQKRKREVGTSQWTFAKKANLFVNTILAFSKVSPILLTTGILAIGLISWFIGEFMLIENQVWSIILKGTSLIFCVAGLLIGVANMRFQGSQKKPPCSVSESV